MKKIINFVKNSVLYPFILTILFTIFALISGIIFEINSDYFLVILIIFYVLLVQGVLHFMHRIMGLIFRPPFLANANTTMFHKYRLFSKLMAPLPAIYLILNSEILIFIAAGAMMLFIFRINYMRTKTIKQETAAFLENNEIDHFVFTAGRATSAYQTNQWIPILEQSEHSFAVIVKNFSIAKAIQTDSVPVFVAPSMYSMEQLIENGAKSILYTGNSIHNIHLLRFTKLRHIFINHGESDKVVNQNKVMLAYDHLFLGGKLAEDRLRASGCDLRADQAIHIGRPQTELSLEKRSLEHGKIQKILYAPTWEGVVDDADYSSVRLEGFQMLQKLSEQTDCEICIKFHPLTGSRNSDRAVHKKKIEDFAAKHNITIYDRQTPIEELMNWSDAMVCDISSVLNEYLYTNKPMILTTFDSNLEGDLSERFPSSKACYLLDNSEKLVEIVGSLENENPEKIRDREELLEYSLSVSKGSALERFDEALGSISKAVELSRVEYDENTR